MYDFEGAQPKPSTGSNGSPPERLVRLLVNSFAVAQLGSLGFIIRGQIHEGQSPLLGALGLGSGQYSGGLCVSVLLLPRTLRSRRPGSLREAGSARGRLVQKSVPLSCRFSKVSSP